MNATHVTETGATTAAASRPHPSSRRLLVLIATVAVVVVLAAVLTGTAPRRAAAGLPDAGRLVGWGVRLGRAGLDLTLLATLGCLVVRLLLGGGRGNRDAVAHLAQVCRRWAVALAVTAAATHLLAAAELAGTSPWAVLTDSRLLVFSASYDQGRALMLLAGVGVLVAVTARRGLDSPFVAAGLLVVGVWAVAPLTAAGHAQAADLHTLASASLFLHVVAACLWCGGLLGLWHLRRHGAVLGELVPRYSAMALGCYVAVVLTGLVTAWTRVGLGGWWSVWGAVAVTKIVLVVALGAAGRAHRRHTMPALRSGRSGAFVRLLGSELLLVGVAVAAAVTLARTPAPPGSAPTSRGPHSDALTGLQVRLPAPGDLAALVQTRLDAPLLLVAVVATVGYLAAARSRAVQAWPRRASACFVAGAVLLVWVWCGPLAVYATSSLTAAYARMLLLLVAVPALLNAGAPLLLWSRALGVARPRVWRPDATTGLVLVAAVTVAVHSTGWVALAQISPALRWTAAAAALVVGLLVSHLTSSGTGAQRLVYGACLTGLLATQGLALARDASLLVDWAARTGLVWANGGTDATALRWLVAAGCCAAVATSLAAFAAARRGERRVQQDGGHPGA